MELKDLEEQRRKLEVERDIRRMQIEKGTVSFVQRYRWPLGIAGALLFWILLNIAAS